MTVEHVDEDGYRTILDGMVKEAAAERFRVSLSRETAEGLLQIGGEVRIRYSDATGLCHFLARVAEVSEGDRVEAWLQGVEKPQCSQRRRFLRLKVTVPAMCVRLDEHGEPRERCTATTLEIGGNGAGVVADRAFTVGERVKVKIELGEKFGLAEATGTVRRSVLALTPEGGEHRVAVQFTQIDSKSQAKILSFLLARRSEAL